MPMDREEKLAAELQTLRTLCDPVVQLRDRQKLLLSLDREDFMEPEHQIVFDSIRKLLTRGSISEAQLRVHLTNRGFPDTDVEKYFPRATARRIHRKPSGTATP